MLPFPLRLCAVPDRIFRFTLSRRVEQSQLLRLGEVKVSIWGLCAGPKSNELLFADSRNGAVRALDMSTSKIASRDTFRCPETESVRSVAYCFETDTLFVVSWNYAARNLNVRACGLTDNEWIECHSLRLPGIGPFKDVLLRVLSRGTICCSQLESDTVHSCLVKEDRSLQQLHRFILSAKHIGFDVHLTTDETLLAAALWDGSVALFSLIGEQCVERSRLKLADLCYLPLFRGETLLVRHRVNDRAEVAAISISGGRLERERVLFPNDQRLVDTSGSWCLLESEATLVLWRREAKELHFYNSNE